jgi:hypothetical protein
MFLKKPERVIFLVLIFSQKPDGSLIPKILKNRNHHFFKNKNHFKVLFAQDKKKWIHPLQVLGLGLDYSNLSIL